MGKKKSKPGNKTASAPSTPSREVDEKASSPAPENLPEPTVTNNNLETSSGNKQKLPLESDAEKAERLKEEGNSFFKSLKYHDAIACYSEAIELRPNEPNYLTNRAASLMALRRFQPALQDCQQAVTLQEDAPSAKTLVRLARCHTALGAPDRALSILDQALQLEPTNSLARTQQASARTMRDHLKSFEAARAKKDWAFARLALEKATAACEGDAPVQWRCWRVELDIARRQWDAASSGAGDALRLDQNSPDVLALRALVMFLAAKFPQAIQHCQSALRLDPEHRKARLLLRRVRDVDRIKEEGNTAFRKGDTTQAVTKYSESLELIGEAEEEGGGGITRATLLSNRATAYVKIKKYDEAIADADASLALQSTSYKALRTRARAYLAQGDFERSVNDFKATLEAIRSDGGADDRVERELREELRKAEIQLKRSKTKDYYKILGLERNCGDAEIKKAYRIASLKHHPDKGGDEEQFKLVAEAYSVLSDPHRRQRYDDGEDEDGQSGSGNPFGGAEVNLADILSQMNGMGGMGGFRFGGSGGSFGGGGGFRHAHGHSHDGFPF